MITYELCLMLRAMPKLETITTLKRTAEAIFEKGGIIRKLENMGTRETPCKTSAHGLVHRTAGYFMYEFNIPPDALENLSEEFSRDVDIVRRRIYKKNNKVNFECTLEEEIQPAPYRKEVQELIANARKMDKPKFKYNTGLNYYPFQK